MQGTFQWLYERVEATCPLRSPSAAWDDWQEVMGKRPSLFKGRVKRACGLQMCLLKVMDLHAEAHRCWSLLTDAEHERQQQMPIGECREACLLCKRAFPTLTSWASHAARVRAYRNPSTQTAVGKTCLACGKVFATQWRLKRHLDHASRCMAAWCQFCPAAGTADCSSHLQAPPILAAGVYDVDFIPSAGHLI